MKKKLVVLPCTLLLLFSVGGCGSVSSHSPNSQQSGGTSINTEITGVYLNYEELTMYKGKVRL